MTKKTSLISVIIWMIFIFVMSSFNSVESTNQSNFIVNIIENILNIESTKIISLIIRKLAHFTEYLILGILVTNMLKTYNKKIYIGIFFCFLYAISDELHQLFIPGRSCQITDILIDTLGAILGIFITKIITKKRRLKIN